MNNRVLIGLVGVIAIVMIGFGVYGYVESNNNGKVDDVSKQVGNEKKSDDNISNDSGIIEQTKKESFRDSVYEIIKSAELGYAIDVLHEKDGKVTFTYVDGVESSSVEGKKLDYKGIKPQNGQIKVNEEGKIALAIHDGTYCAEKMYDKSEVTIVEKDLESCTIES